MVLYDRDHAGGNEKIKQLIPGIKVYGGSVDNVKGCTDRVENGDKIALGKDTSILALHTPWYYSSYAVMHLICNRHSIKFYVTYGLVFDFILLRHCIRLSADISSS